jgi:hypothetical protein
MEKEREIRSFEAAVYIILTKQPPPPLYKYQQRINHHEHKYFLHFVLRSIRGLLRDFSWLDLF